MAFIDQVQDLTSLTVSDTDELSQFLKDGVLDVTNRWLAVKPQDAELFGRESSETTSNASLNLNSARIISVVREDGVTSDNWRPCRKISPAQQYLVTDVESLSYASKINPAYMVGDAGKISVFPAPGADPNAFKVYYVNKDPVNSSGSALIHSHDDILYFPIDKVYLVVMYAGIRLLHAAMGATTISDLTVSAVPPEAPTITASTVSFSAAIPTYTPPTITTKVSFEDFWEAEEDSNPFGDNDPGSSVVTAVPPDAVSDTIANYDLSNGDFDDAMSKAKNLIDNASTLSQGQDAEYWLNDEDPEMVGATIQVAAQEIQRANLALQDALQVFNTDLQKFQASGTGRLSAEVAAYQAEVNTQVQDYGQKLQRYTAEMGIAHQAWAKTESDSIQIYQSDIQNELNDFNEKNAVYQAQLQVSVQNAQLEDAEEAKKLQKYAAEVQAYQAEVGAEVQEYTQNLQADGTGYQWLQDQYTRLKTEYDQVFIIAAPKQQPQQQVRG